jgi:hypothetical protein
MPRLTEQEQQEIIRFIEADRPLPDKYRFLLFEDKREVELVWNGKTSEVCNIVLPFQVIEQVDEPRAEKPEETKRKDKNQALLFSLDERGRQFKGWASAATHYLHVSCGVQILSPLSRWLGRAKIASIS